MQSEKSKTKPISLSFFLGPNINRPTVDTSACVSSAITLPDLSAVFRLDASSFPTLPGDNSSALCHFCSPNRGLRSRDPYQTLSIDATCRVPHTVVEREENITKTLFTKEKFDSFRGNKTLQAPNGYRVGKFPVHIVCSTQDL
ncbi:hypothetical protein J6590_082791 [Homalodisca vitripennis]|nr:hypothetical protein J6590_082791 [Homalodisca vitripennis]